MDCNKKRADGGLGLSVCCAFDDSMHSVDLGVNPHLLGNVLWHLVYTDILVSVDASYEAVRCSPLRPILGQDFSS